jgi:hypothetical protein
MTHQQRVILIGAAAAIAGFAIGALWQYGSARGYAQRVDRTEHTLAFTRLEATLGAATIEAQRGSHEIGRQLASDFFTGLQQVVNEAPADRQPALREILQRRDAMITALSRADPQSGPMLAQLFLRYRIAMGEQVGPTDDVSSPPAPRDTPAQAPPADTAPGPG